MQEMTPRDAQDPDEVPIRRVRSDGVVELVGSWRPHERALELSAIGYPLLGPGRYPVEGDLPWAFDEMAPDGYLAERFTRWYPELGLPAQRALWTPAQLLSAISIRGHDLGGNLLVGEQTDEIFRLVVVPNHPRGLRRQHAPLVYAVLVDRLLQHTGQSSIGGARPKLGLSLEGGAGLIVKFTPPLSTPSGRRWADLLRLEMHCATVLRAAGREAVASRYFEQEDRGYLEIERFDRLAGGGRLGHVTLYHLGMEYYSEMANPAAVVAGLVRDGHLPEEDQRRFALQHAFSAAIGNTDTHQGNYGLLFDDAGRARLSPAYDVLPMAFAPRHDELPDRLVAPFAAAPDSAVAGLVEHLAEVVRTDAALDPALREAWLSKLA